MTAPVRYLVGDALDRLAELPDGTVDLVLTSPPFLGLRQYLPDGHPDKDREIGTEPTPAQFIDTVLAVAAAARRVLTRTGTLAVELGDTYSTRGGGATSDNRRWTGNGTDLIPRRSRVRTPEWPQDKSLCGIPAALQLSLAYGWNVLDRQGPDSPAGQWLVRNHVAWVRTNPPVGALSDKYRPASSYITVAATSPDRWFDIEAVRAEPNPENARGTAAAAGKSDRHTIRRATGAPPNDWWSVPTSNYPGAHFAVWPPELLRTPIQSMCPRRVCRTCSIPSRRLVDYEPGDLNLDRPQARRALELAEAAGLTPAHIAAIRSFGIRDVGKDAVTMHGRNRPEVERLAAEAKAVLGGYFREFNTVTATTRGWTTCGCPGTDGVRHDGYHTGPGWRPGVVLDPFAGSGTTLAVAQGLGRHAIGIDLDYRNAGLALDRLGPLAGLDITWPDGDLTLPALPPADTRFDAYRTWEHLLDLPDDPDPRPSVLTAPAAPARRRPAAQLAGQGALI